MSRLSLVMLAALAGVAFQSSPLSARDRDRDYRDYRHEGRWAHEYENRRDARRAGIVAGAVREGVAEAATEHRYQECMMTSGYDYACEQQRYRDEAHAHRAARRTAVVVGAAVRDY